MTWRNPEDMPDELDRVIAHGAKSRLVKQDWLNRYLRRPGGEDLPEPHRQVLRDLGYAIPKVGPSWVQKEPVRYKTLPSDDQLKQMRSPHPVRPPYAIFCTPDQSDDSVYTGFTHEAAFMLIALGSAVKRGEMTDVEAFQAWSPYRHVARWVYKPAFIKQWNGFPIVGESLDYDEMPGLGAFTHAVEALDFPGVGSESSPMYESITITSDILDQVSHHLRHTYRIVVLFNDEFREGQGQVEDTRRKIARAHEGYYETDRYAAEGSL